MGVALSSILANLFMSYFETINPKHLSQIISWLRYVDEIFRLAHQSNFDDFFTKLNGLHRYQDYV